MANIVVGGSYVPARGDAYIFPIQNVLSCPYSLTYSLLMPHLAPGLVELPSEADLPELWALAIFLETRNTPHWLSRRLINKLVFFSFLNSRTANVSLSLSVPHPPATLCCDEYVFLGVSPPSPLSHPALRHVCPA